MGLRSICQAPCGRDLGFCVSFYWGHIDLQRALELCKKNYSYRTLRFGMECKLCTSVVVRLALLNQQFHRRTGQGRWEQGSVEAAGGEGPRRRASMPHSPISAKAPLLLYALHIEFCMRLYLQKRIALIGIILRPLIRYSSLLVQDFPLQYPRPEVIPPQFTQCQ